MEKQYDDDFLYRMRDEVVKKVEKSEEFQEQGKNAAWGDADVAGRAAW